MSIRRLRERRGGHTAFESWRVWLAGAGWTGCDFRSPGAKPAGDVERWTETKRGNKPVLMIRLSRRGARKQPVYRIIVIEKDRARDGRSIEVVGLYNPRTNPATVDLKRDRIEYWLAQGAQLSPTLARLYKNAAAVAAPAVALAPAVAAEPAVAEPAVVAEAAVVAEPAAADVAADPDAAGPVA
jgi:small subunit ribosomal protein S16